MKKTKILLFVFMLAIASPLLLLAQDEVPVDVNPDILAKILYAFGGIVAITQIIKQVLKVAEWDEIWRKIAGYGISLVVSAGLTVYILITNSMFSVGSLILYTIVAWATANGFWKALREIIKKYAHA